MHSFLQYFGIVLLPLIISNSLHMWVVKKDYFTMLKRPIAQKIFGENKTWRGVMFVPLVNAIILVIITSIFELDIAKPFLIGFLFGMGYIIFELPNSYLKRTLGIPPGEQGKSNRILFLIIDKTDSAFGVLVIYYSLGYCTWHLAILLFVFSSLTHLLISSVLLHFKLKKSL